MFSVWSNLSIFVFIIMEQSKDLYIKITTDGSNTLFCPELNEHYHSVNGAIQESMHVFIRNGLNFVDKIELNVLEIGFGTGLNALLTAVNGKAKTICYTAIELYPLMPELAYALNYPEQIKEEDVFDLFSKLHAAPWEKKYAITSNFTLLKRKADFTTFIFSDSYDLIYFDAFAPDKQPEMWNQYLFDRLYSVTAKGGVLTTYCAKGIVRRGLQQSGYVVNRLPGPPGKREMLQAIKKEIEPYRQIPSK